MVNYNSFFWKIASGQPPCIQTTPRQPSRNLTEKISVLPGMSRWYEKMSKLWFIGWLVGHLVLRHPFGCVDPNPLSPTIQQRVVKLLNIHRYSPYGPVCFLQEVSLIWVTCSVGDLCTNLLEVKIYDHVHTNKMRRTCGCGQAKLGELAGGL